jgi:hypothetical protein
MSLRIVSKRHIDVLVEALFRYEVPLPQAWSPDDVGRMLWEANHHSVNYRYHKRHRTPAYVHARESLCFGNVPAQAWGTVQEVARQPVFVFKQLACFMFQACDFPGWEQSLACRVCEALEHALLANLHMDKDAVGRCCDGLPWGIA